MASLPHYIATRNYMPYLDAILTCSNEEHTDDPETHLVPWSRGRGVRRITSGVEEKNCRCLSS